MKKIALLLVTILLGVTSLHAQRFAFVDTESVFENLTEYTQAQAQLNDLQERLQNNLQSEYSALESSYNKYRQEKDRLTANQRQIRENQILEKEEEIREMQEAYFGQDGQMAQKTRAWMEPIQNKVQQAIEFVAIKYEYDMILDKNAGMGVLYYNEALDVTRLVLERLRTIK